MKDKIPQFTNLDPGASAALTGVLLGAEIAGGGKPKEDKRKGFLAIKQGDSLRVIGNLSGHGFKHNDSVIVDGVAYSWVLNGNNHVAVYCRRDHDGSSATVLLQDLEPAE